MTEMPDWERRVRFKIEECGELPDFADVCECLAALDAARQEIENQKEVVADCLFAASQFRDAVLEQAEQVCRQLAARASDYPQSQPGYDLAQAEARGCLSCADAIRALKEQS